MIELNLLLSWLLFIIIIPFFFFFFFFLIKITHFTHQSSSSSSTTRFPRSYPLIGSHFSLYLNRNRFTYWITDILTNSPNGTFVLKRAFGSSIVYTVNPENVKHILKSNFSVYPKGDFSTTILSDFLGTGIFNSDGDTWKFQRQISSHEFNTKSLRKFIENVVKTELYDRLIPILSSKVEEDSILDLQDILQRFAFDNICKISFGFDPEYLKPSLPRTEFAAAFDEATQLTTKRYGYIIPLVWKIKRFFGIGSEKKLKQATSKIREYAKNIVIQKKQELKEKTSLEATDLLSRFMKYENLDDDFLINIVISFILAGQDTTSAALTWFFWLVSWHPEVEEEILKEINQARDELGYDEVKDMTYIHASICESMRLYPPVPFDSKQAIADDILPDGTVVKKGTRVGYHPYAMGRMENLWGSDWKEFKPERWLERDKVSGKLNFIPKDSYTYPVFQAGPRVCLGKEMAFLQMKMLVVGILRRFRVVSAIENGSEPVFLAFLTSKMHGGFPVKIEERA